MQPGNPFRILGEQTEMQMEVEVQDVCTEVKRCVETWRDEPIPESTLKSFEGQIWTRRFGLHEFPHSRGIVYKQLAGMYETVVAEHMKASMEIFHRGVWLDEALEDGRVLEEEVFKLRNQVARLNHEASEAKGKLLQSEVAREKAEAEWKTLVEQRDKWRREAENTKKEKDKLEKDLRQDLRAAKLAATRAPMTASATQSQPPPTTHSTTTQTEKPTYVSVAA